MFRFSKSHVQILVCFMWIAIQTGSPSGSLASVHALKGWGRKGNLKGWCPKVPFKELGPKEPISVCKLLIKCFVKQWAHKRYICILIICMFDQSQKAKLVCKDCGRKNRSPTWGWWTPNDARHQMPTQTECEANSDSEPEDSDDGSPPPPPRIMYRYILNFVKCQALLRYIYFIFLIYFGQCLATVPNNNTQITPKHIF